MEDMFVFLLCWCIITLLLTAAVIKLRQTLGEDRVDRCKAEKQWNKRLADLEAVIAKERGASKKETDGLKDKINRLEVEIALDEALNKMDIDELQKSKTMADNGSQTENKISTIDTGVKLMTAIGVQTDIPSAVKNINTVEIVPTMVEAISVGKSVSTTGPDAKLTGVRSSTSDINTNSTKVGDCVLAETKVHRIDNSVQAKATGEQTDVLGLEVGNVGKVLSSKDDVMRLEKGGAAGGPQMAMSGDNTENEAEAREDDPEHQRANKKRGRGRFRGLLCFGKGRRT